MISFRSTAVALAWATALAATAQPERELALRSGEQQLAAGDLAAAETTFERIAGGGHDAAAEIAAVRIYLQRGDYRQALSFAAHAAGAHSDAPQATALYAWLLHVGGQQVVGHRLLQTTMATSSEATLAAASRALAEPWPVATGRLLEPPARLAPYASGDTAHGAVVATATLLRGGRRALTTGSAIAADAVEIWVRNGLGATVRASVERRFDVGGSQLALLALDAPLPLPDGYAVAERAPFAGSVAYAAEFAATPESAEPAWPMLRLGFMGRARTAAELPLLGIDVPPGPRGGAVFDDMGRFVGIALRANDGDRLATVAALPDDVQQLLGERSPGGPTSRSAMDAIYERALRTTLQLIVQIRRE